MRDDSRRDRGRALAYEGERPDVERLVPRTARRVLDLGCASGALGASLKRRQPVEVVGIERDGAYAAAANERLDRVVEGDVTTALGEPGDLGRFDCVVAADILEHLVDPATTLRAAAELLEPGARAVISLPNVRFYETFWQLGARGTWPRRAHGIFDETHLRWFTRRDALELVEEAGLRATHVAWNLRVRPRGSRFDHWFRWLGRTPVREFFVYQYLLVAEKRA